MCVSKVCAVMVEVLILSYSPLSGKHAKIYHLHIHMEK